MSSVPLPIIDPHFHVWNVHTHPNPTLGELGERLPVYSLLDYERDAGIGVSGYVHIETVVGQAAGAAKKGLDPVDETRGVLQQAAMEGRERQVKVVAFVKLSQMPEAAAVLAAHQAVAGGKLVGVRMILNYSDEDEALTWPQVERGDFLTGGVPSFREGFALLGKHGLSFDLQVNWFQLRGAAAFLQGFPDTVVVLDHMGCLKLTGAADEEEDAKRVAEWREGMRALASLPNVYVKLSMLEYVRQGWMDASSAAHGVVKGLVRETIALFGPGRCMFASNFPVDKLLVASLESLEGLVAAQHALVADMEEEDRRALFHDTAALVYKFVVPPVSLAMPAQHEEGAAATAATTEPSAAEAEAASEATV